MEKMDNENYLDENYSELKKCLACGKQYRTTGGYNIGKK